MDPTQHYHLFEEVKKLETLRRAWLAVRPRVRASNFEKTRRDAANIEENSEHYLRRLQIELRRGEYEFEPQRGVAKLRKGKMPRPIVVAPVGNRIVQRAILDVLQSKRGTIQKKLGGIPALLATPTSIGGIPKRGVRDAVRLITAEIKAGRVWYVRSDIKDFFTSIRRDDLRDFLSVNVKDSKFIKLFDAALNVDLENAAELRDWIQLFPTDGLGVPQGSSLSALSANIALRDFDHQMNGRGITTVRYLDDFVILGSTKSSTEKAWNSARNILNDLGFEVHDPAEGTGKAKRGKVEDGLEFLSLRFSRGGCAPTRDACQNLISELQVTIREAKSRINAISGQPRRAEQGYAQALVLLDRKVRGWGDAFACCDIRLQFHQLDTQIDELVDDFEAWWARRATAVTPVGRRRSLGIALLKDTL